MAAISTNKSFCPIIDQAFGKLSLEEVILPQDNHTHDERLDYYRTCLPQEIQRKSHLVFLEVLGVGGFGTVIKATDDGKAIAVKVSRGPENLAEEAQKYEALKQDQVPHVPQFLGTTDVRFFCQFCKAEKSVLSIKMPLYSGSLFEHYVDKGRKMPTDHALLMMQQLVATLKVMEARNWVHRDIKPDNVMVDESNGLNFVLGDWGSATKFDPAEGCSQLTGTLPYKAPEEILLKRYDVTVDSFSLYLVLFNMLTEQNLFSVPPDFVLENINDLTRQHFDEMNGFPPEAWFAEDKASRYVSSLFREDVPGFRTFAYKPSAAYKDLRKLNPLPKNNWDMRLVRVLMKRRVSGRLCNQICDLGLDLIQYERPKPSIYQVKYSFLS